MQRYILIRSLQVLAALLVISVIIFLTIRLTGDPRDILLPPDAREEDYRALGQELGLDKPLVVQYEIFLINAVQLDFGRSIRTGRPVGELILAALPNSV